MRSQASPPVPGIAALAETSRDPHAVVDAVLGRLADRRGDAAWISVFTPAELYARAGELAARGPAGLPLFGVPFAV